jgi:hypothetical protein
VVGLVEGQTDLYQFEIKTKKVSRLTSDVYAELHPSFNKDGSVLTFSTDQLSFEKNKRVNGKWNFNIATLPINSLGSENLTLFSGADCFNPVYDSKGDIYFISNANGIRNIYKYETLSKRTLQMTDFITGVSGITEFAPAITVSRKRDRILYTHFEKGGYDILEADSEDFLNKEVNANEVSELPALLPVVKTEASVVKIVDGSTIYGIENKNGTEKINTSLALMNTNIQNEEIKNKVFKSKFKLDYIGGSAGGGIGMVNGLGMGMNALGAGGIQALFSDILGNHQLQTTFAVGNNLLNSAGMFNYINQKSRLPWGLNFQHVPFLSGGEQYQGRGFVPELGQTVDVYNVFEQRLFEDRLGGFTFYPFHTTLRAEANASFSFYNYNLRSYNLFVDPFTQQAIANTQPERIRASDVGLSNFNLASVGTALVGDNAIFGIASPLKGSRFRLGIDHFADGFNFNSVIVDGRKYFRFKPFTFAFRGMNISRFGRSARPLLQNSTDLNIIPPFFLGNPVVIRGLPYTPRIRTLFQENGINELALFANSNTVGNFEIRIPFTGPKGVSLIPTNFLMTELSFFSDNGIAWDQFRDLENAVSSWRTQDRTVVGSRSAWLSTLGASLRVNLFGSIILEPYYAIPMISGNRQGAWGLNIFPGW